MRKTLVASSLASALCFACGHAPSGQDVEGAQTSSIIAPVRSVRSVDEFARAAASNTLAGATVDLDLVLDDATLAQLTRQLGRPFSFAALDLTDTTFARPVLRGDFGGAKLLGTRFRSAVSGASFNNATLEGVEFEGQVVQSTFSFAQMTRVRFQSDVVHSNFLGFTLLKDVQFLGAVVENHFMYATFDGWSFADAKSLVRCNFLDTRFVGEDLPDTLPPALDVEGSVFTLTRFARPHEQVLPHRRINDPATLQRFGGPSVIRATSDAELLRRFRDWAGEDTDHLIPPAWRSLLWDTLHPALWGTTPYWKAKAFVFDETSGIYFDSQSYAALRAQTPPTLTYFLDRFAQKDLVAGIVAQGLRSMLLSNEPAYLDDPYVGLVSYASGEYRMALEARQVSATPEGIAQWLAAPLDWNGNMYTVGDVALSPSLLDAMRRSLRSTRRAAFDAIAADGNVSLGQLQGAGFDTLVEYAFHRFR